MRKKSSDVVAGEQSLEHRAVTSSTLQPFNTCCDFTFLSHQPSASFNFDLVARPDYSLPVPVGLRDMMLRDVTAEHDGQQQQSAHDLDSMPPLILAGSRSVGDLSRSLDDIRNENDIFSQQRVAAEPAQPFKSRAKRRGLALMSHHLLISS